MNARLRPQRLQRVYARARNFGFRLAFTIKDVLAKRYPLVARFTSYTLAKGTPSIASSWRASSSVLADVQIVMFIP